RPGDDPAQDRLLLRAGPGDRGDGGAARADRAHPRDRRAHDAAPLLMGDWRANLIEEDEEAVAALVRSAKRVAVLGIKTEAQANQPAFYVPKHLHDAGVAVIPVPVYYPEVKEILGQRVHRTVAEVPGPIDIVDVFRRSEDVAAHL